MARSSDRFPQWVFYLIASFLYGAVVLRTLILYPSGLERVHALGILLLWLALFVSEPAISYKSTWYFQAYLTLQAALVYVLLAFIGPVDFFAVLLIILGMQAMLRLSPRVGALWLGLFSLMIPLLLTKAFGLMTIALTLIYTAAIIFLGSYALAARRAQEARRKTRALAQELQVENQKLMVYVAQLEGISVARERNRLARELHDSVTQTVFSMNLTTQSAAMLLDRDMSQVGIQLERLNYLARRALSEMQLLVSELRPEDYSRGGLVSAIHHHLMDSRLAESLSVSLRAEGDEPLAPEEELCLFRIAQEALNNIMKHAGTSQAQIHIHLAEPIWMKIEDQGQGFDLQHVQNGSRMGLVYMRERAAEIGWDLHIFSSPGAGTCVRVEKSPSREVQYDIPK